YLSADPLVAALWRLQDERPRARKRPGRARCLYRDQDSGCGTGDRQAVRSIRRLINSTKRQKEIIAMDAVLDPLERDSSTRVGRFDMTDQEGSRGSFRPIVRGSQGAVSTGHLLPSMAGYDMLRRGGNAADAGVAAGLCH